MDSGHGPHVTLVAGIEMAGRHWSTTSTSAAKVRMIRARPHAAVLRSAGDDDWTLLAGRATVLDARRPLDALTDPVGAACAGLAIGRIGLANVAQLAGYLEDLADIPRLWGPASRVLLVVRDDHRLSVRDGVVVEATGDFAVASALPAPSARPRRRPVDGTLVTGLSPSQRSLIAVGGPCAVGLSTSVGTVVIPGSWDPASCSAGVDRAVLARLGAILPGPCTVTLDSSGDVHPTAKVGVMLRGSATLVGPPRANRAAEAGRSIILAVRVGSITAWDGFGVGTTRAA